MICAACNKEFIPKVQNRNIRCCSKSCGYQFRRITSGNIPRNCLICNKPITNYKGKFCSSECSIEYKFKVNTLPRFLNGEISDTKTLRRVISKIRGNKCEVCNITVWENKPITFQLDHIDGNASNNLPINVRLICPNCHSQTDNFAGRNRGNGRKSRGIFSTNIYNNALLAQG